MNQIYIVLYLDDAVIGFPRVVGVPQRELALAQQVANKDWVEILGEPYPDGLDWEEHNDERGHYWDSSQDLFAYAIYEVPVS
jgi:hypothetical protein